MTTTSSDETIDSTPTTEPKAAAAATAGLGLCHVDPGTLLVDRNVRHQVSGPARAEAAAAMRTLVASVREHGVLVPIVAVRLADGRLRLRMGDRRTHAAFEAGLGSLPVLVRETDGDADTAQRVIEQWTENEHRAGLATSERIGAVAQLAAFGLTAATIARRTKTPRVGVEAALAASRSAVAVDTADAHQLTLEEAAAHRDRDIRPYRAAAAGRPGRGDRTCGRGGGRSRAGDDCPAVPRRCAGRRGAGRVAG